MKKPNNFDNTQAQGEFVPVELGGHYLVIKKLWKCSLRQGKTWLRYHLILRKTINSRNILKRCFGMIYGRKRNGPIRLRNIFLQRTMKEIAAGPFKTFITCVEHSNKGFKLNGVISSKPSLKISRSAEYLVRRWIIMTEEKKKKGSSVVYINR